MYRTWQHLIIQNETGLQDPVRLKKLLRSSGSVGLSAIVGFFTAGALSVLIAIFLFNEAFRLEEKQLSLILSGVAILVLSISFFVGSWLFWKERNLNLLRNFLRSPGDFIFIQGRLEDCHYLPGEKRSSDRIIVEGHAKGPSGDDIIVREEFSPRIWNFTTPDAEESLKKGSDWYDKKGKRRLLPVPAYFICNKHRPAWAQLVAINHEYILSD